MTWIAIPLAGLTVLSTLAGGFVALRLHRDLQTLIALTGGIVVAVALFDVLPEAMKAVGEVVADHGHEDDQAGGGVHVEGEPDAEPVDEAVDREPGRPDRPHLGVRAGLLRVVPVVEHERALGEEEGEEAGADEGADAARAAERLDRLGQHVEERDRDDDAAGERDQRLEVAVEPERGEAAEERRDDGERGERDRDPGHGTGPIIR